MGCYISNEQWHPHSLLSDERCAHLLIFTLCHLPSSEKIKLACLTNLPLLPGIGLSFSMTATCYPSATCSSQRLPRAPRSFYVSRTEPYLGDIGPNFSNLLLLLTFSSFSSSPPFLLLYRPRACFAGDIAHHFSFSFLPSLLHFPSQQFEDNEAPPQQYKRESSASVR